MISSFDIFDTCLVRRTFVPSDVFRRITARLLQLDETLNEAPSFIEDFAAARWNAERRAPRFGPNSGETTLEAIWKTLTEMINLGIITTAQGAQVELEEEAKVLGPIANIATLIASRRAAGDQIAFISDTYLPESFIKSQLERFELIREGDPLFVSSTHGKTKCHGDLFDHFLNELAVDASTVTHHGDNLVSDIRHASSRGLNTRRIDTLPTPVERLVGEVEAEHRRDVAGNLRYHRLSTQKPPREGAQAFVERFMGPVTCLIAHWLLDQAERDGVQRLYFAARDARLLYTATVLIAKRRESNVQCQYLKVSRRALLLPSSREVSPSGMPWLFPNNDYRQPTLRRLFSRLEIEEVGFLKHWGATYPEWDIDKDYLDTEAIERFWEILTSEGIQSTVEEQIEIRREAALNYLRREGFLEPDIKIGYVDIGWALTSQTALKQLRKLGGTEKEIHGYYLAQNFSRMGSAESGSTKSIIHDSASDLGGRASSWIRKYHTVFEHVFGLADHTSVIDYSSDGKPNLKLPMISNFDKNAFIAVENALKQYVEEKADCWRPMAEPNAGLAELLDDIIVSYFEEPEENTLSALSHLVSASGQEHDDLLPLFRPYGVKEVLAAMAPRPAERWFGIKPMDFRQWPQASLAITPSIIHYLMEVASYPRTTITGAIHVFRNSARKSENP